MAHHEMPAVPEHARTSAPRDAPAHASASAAARWAISRGQLFMLLAVLLPAAASMLAPVMSGDIAYQIRAGQLMLGSGTVIDTDPFTFTVFGEPWVNQQWGASIILALGHDAVGWAGLLLLRAVLIGLTFGLVYAACRGVGANSIVAALVTLGTFIVAATNLALRAQTFGMLSFAAVVAILAWRRRHPLLLWLVPLIMLFWANTHGSFFIGWAAIGVAAIDDLQRRSRLAGSTIVVGLLSVLVTLLHPWGIAMWEYVLEISRNPLVASLVSEWQPSTPRTATGLFFFISVAVVVALLLLRGRVISWLQIAWLAGLAALGLVAVRGVAWWAIGSAPLVALLASGLVVRNRRLGDKAFDVPRGIGYSAIAGAATVLAIATLPLWRPIDPLYGPEGMLRHAPRGVTETLLAEAAPSDRLFAEQTWGSWFEYAVPGVPVMVDSRIELFDEATWGDYLHAIAGRVDWAEILDRWDVSLVAIGSGAPLRPFLDASADWAMLYEDGEGVVYRRLLST